MEARGEESAAGLEEEEKDTDTINETISTEPPGDHDESRLSLTPTRELPTDAKLSPILNRTIPGSCSLQNRGSLSWGAGGCLSYGCGNLVVVVEPATAQYLQVLSKHRWSVTRTAWSMAGGQPLRLASADAGGHIITWDVKQGESLKQFQDGNQVVTDLRWLDGRIQKTSHLLLAVHPPNHLVLWNSLTGAKVWRVSYNEPTIGLDLDPFNCFRLMLLSHNCVLFVEDFHPEKCPKGSGQKFYIVGAKGVSPGRATATTETTLSANEERGTKGKRLSRIMRQMVLGETRESQPGGEVSVECLSSSFHRGVEDLIVLAFAKEVLLVDVKLSQAIGSINLERVHSPLAAIRTCADNDVIMILHESGSVSVWGKKQRLTVLATPSMSRSQSLTGFNRVPGFPNPDLEDGYGLAGSDMLLEIAYESKVQSDHVRMGKNIKVLGLAVHPITEKQIAYLTSDGRVYILDYAESEEERTTFAVPAKSKVIETSRNPRLRVSCILGSSSSLVKVMRMCPALTIKNWKNYSPLLAAGSVTGNILVFDVASGCLLREIAVHTAEVRELEWTSTNPSQSCLSCSYHPVTGNSNLVRNELVHTNILNGKIRMLRVDRGEEPKITMIRVSHAKQYFVLAFSAGPFELWDIKKLCLLRTMPKKFPLVTSLVWSPAHRSKKKNVSGGSGEAGETESPRTGQQPAAAARSQESPRAGQRDELHVKEHILFTDVDSQLYHFSVEGHSIRDGTKIPAETGIGHINCIACKSDLIVRGDSDGNINIWNIKERQSKNIHTGRGNIKDIKFSPGRGNMKILVLHSSGVAVWDVKELELINELRVGPDIVGVVCVDWAASDRVMLLCQDGSVRVMGLALAGSSSPALLYHRQHPLSCASVLGSRLVNDLVFNQITSPSNQPTEEEGMDVEEADDKENKAEDFPEIGIAKAYQRLTQNPRLSYDERNLEFAHLLGLRFEKHLWSLVYHKLNGLRVGRSFGICADKGSYLELQEERCKLHLNRAADKDSRGEVTARLLCLGELEPAVKLLLETEPTEDTFLSDQLLACLVQTSSPAEGSHMSTTKMVATKLIAEGSLWVGVELLCLAGKVWDACTYLRASKHWSDCIWLAKCRLSDADYCQISKKYADHLVSEGRIEEAALLLASIENWNACLEVLHLGQYWSLAARLLHIFGDSVEPVLCEAIWLEAARSLFEAGNRDAANHFCDKIGDKGLELKKEFCHVVG